MVFPEDLLYEIMTFQLLRGIVTYNSNLDWMGIDQRMWNYDVSITISFL